MKKTAFSKIEMSPLEFDLGLSNESGAIAYERAATASNGNNTSIEPLAKVFRYAELSL